MQGKGNGKLKGKGKGKGPPPGEEGAQQDMGPEDNPPAAQSTWYVYTAQTVSKVNKSIQDELMGTKLMGYFIEWCQRPTKRIKGNAYQDAAVRYNDDDPNMPIVEYLKTRSPENTYTLEYQFRSVTPCWIP